MIRKFLITNLLLVSTNLVFAGVEPVLIRTLTEVTGGGLSVSGSTVAVVTTFEKITFSISVSTTNGSQIIASTGTITGCSINPPAFDTTYDFEIVTNDLDQFAIAGQGSIYGKAGLSFDRFILGEHIFKIENASNAGVYKVRCVIRR